MPRQGKKRKPSRKQSTPTAQPNNFELNISDIASQGDGMGKHGKRTVFVPFTIPGERVRVSIVKDKGQVVYAEGVDLLIGSADRVRSRCRHFGKQGCSNCQWQHMDYSAQLALKMDVLIDLFERVGGFDSDKIGLQDIIPSPQQWDYRTQADFFPTGEGNLGYWSTDLNRAIPIYECPILHPAVFALFEELDLDVPNLTNIRIQIGSYDTAMVVIRTRDETVPELETTLPISMNFLLNDNVPVNLLGETHIVQRLKERDFRITAGTQFRHYPEQNERLIEVVVDYLRAEGTEMVLDLYGGAGIFSAFIAPLVSYVTYVDSYPPAATDAEVNLEAFENVDILEGSVEDVLSDLYAPAEAETDEADADEQGELESYEQYDVAILDPSREGMTQEARAALGKLAIPKLIYVSQDMETMARDLKDLVKRNKYRLLKTQPIDFDPQSYRVQAVALLVKES